MTAIGESEAEGFETGLGAWTVLDAPASSTGNASDFVRTNGLGGIISAITTPDTVMLGFGPEQLATDAERAAVAGRVLSHLLG
ncbi:hypothetical protein [Microterricola viridarii]|uniref:Uncharacterized protein n=1 Tax=Microterricola viridarii TaxID=412690 RepID=A0A109QX15_9MICO|nr:hypothetical protein [Microterricola viridarii]AMB59179.1 hypothetical protein AWU67_10245 [Microterricola viridarii]